MCERKIILKENAESYHTKESNTILDCDFVANKLYTYHENGVK